MAIGKAARFARVEISMIRFPSFRDTCGIHVVGDDTMQTTASSAAAIG